MAVRRLTVWAVFFLSLITHTTGQRSCTNGCLVWSNKTDINVMDTNGHHLRNVFSGGTSIRGIDVNIANNKIYWSETETQTIHRINMDGTNMEEIYAFPENNFVYFLAVDYVTNDLIYWSDWIHEMLGSVKMDGTDRKIFFDNVIGVASLGISPTKGYLFWADNDYVYNNPKIERSSLHGTDRTVIVSSLTATNNPIGLTVDDTAHIVYISDFSASALYSFDFDGQQFTTILQDKTYNPGDIALFQNKLYFIDRNEDAIFSVDTSPPNQIVDSFTHLDEPKHIQVFHDSRQNPGTNPCTGSTCSDICFIDINNGHQCGCPTGFALKSDGVTCRNDISQFILIAERLRGVIKRVSLDVTPLVAEPLPIHYKNITDPVGLHYDPLDGYMYWSDVGVGAIFRANPDGSDLVRLIDDRVSYVQGVAVDQRGRKLYWCDGQAHAIEVSKLDGTYRKTLVAAYNPSHLKLHLGKSYMFWTEMGWSSYLKRADMDGKNVLSIRIIRGYSASLAVDETRNKVILWSSYYNEIVSMDLDGSNEAVIFTESLLHVYGMDVSGDYLYFSDYVKYELRRLDMANAYASTTIGVNIRYSGDVYVYDINEASVGANPCGNDENGCSHLCLPNPSNWTCVCPSGLTSEDGGTTCMEGGSQLLLLTDYYDEKIYLKNLKAKADDGLEVLPFDLSNSRGPAAVDYDPYNTMVYWSDIYNSKIVRAHLDGSDQQVLYHNGISAPYGMVVDYISGIIFWTDRSKNTIEVGTMDGKYRRTLIGTGLDSPKGLAADLNQNLLFFTEEADPAKISRVYMNGSDLRVIVHMGASVPNGVAVDPSTQTIYWTDSDKDQVESSNYEGNNRDIIHYSSSSSLSNRPFGIGTGIGHLFWSDTAEDALYMVNITAGSSNRTRQIVESNLPYALGVTVYDEDKYKGSNTTCSVNNGNCQQICLPSNNNVLCVCQDGDLLQSDGNTCKAEEFNDRFILLTDFWLEKLYVISMSTGFRKTLNINLTASRGPSAVAYDYCNHFIYWTDVWDEKICRARMNGSDYEELITTDLLFPSAIRLDCKAGNMYIVDSMTHDIFIATMDGKKRRPLVFGADSPQGLDIDLDKGLLFWVESSYTSGRAMVWNANIDGTSPNMIFDITQYGAPTDITADTFLQRLFWSDAQKNAIYSASYGGSNVQIVHSDTGSIVPYSIDFAVDALYWVDMSGGHIYKTNLTTSVTEVFVSGLTYSLGLYVHDKAKYQDLTNPCTNNGGCEYMCVRTRFSSRCMCAAGMLLKSDKRTCEKPTRMDAFLLVSDYNEINIVSLDPVVDFVKETLLNGSGMIPFQPLALGYDPIDQMMYWTDSYHMIIAKSSLDGHLQKILHHCDVRWPGGIAVDWIGRFIYWTDAGSNRIEVSELDGTNRSILINHDIDEPNTILVDPVNGWMYWADWGANPRIQRAHMDGSNVMIIAKYGLGLPHGITLDDVSSKLYWGDTYSYVIERSDLDGSNREVIVNSLSQYTILQGLAFFDDHVYWADMFDLVVRRADVSNGNTSENHIAVRGNFFPRDIYIFDPKAKAPKTNPCVNNGGCSHLCLIIPGGTTCACPTGIQLKDDLKTCDTDAFKLQESTGGFILVTDEKLSRIEKIPLTILNHPCTVLPISNNISKPIAVAYDPIDDQIYWSDYNNNHILRVNSDGMNEEVIVEQAFSTYGIAIDILGRTIYWTSNLLDTVDVSSLDGSHRRELYSGLYYVNPIVLDPENSVMYFGGYGYLTMGYMDGTYKEDLPINYLGMIVALSLDLETKNLYYSDYYDDSISVYNVKTMSGPRLVVTLGAWTSAVYGMTFYNQGLYYLDSSTDTLHVKNVTTGADYNITTGIETGWDIEAYGPLSYPQGKSTCSVRNGQCSKFCLPNPNGTSCFCPTGVQLKPDGKTCEGDCGHLEIPEYGTLGRCTVKPGAKCSISCNKGFRREGPNYKTCLANGTWTGEDFKCIDTVPPKITCPPNIIKDNDAGKGYTSVNWPSPITTDNTNKDPVVTSSIPIYSRFYIGTTTVLLVATDEAGLNATCSFTVTVVDKDPPDILCCPSDEIVNTFEGQNSATFLFGSATVTDNSEPRQNVTLTVHPAIQTPHKFVIGRHPLTYIATDEAGLNSSCNFTIEIKDVEKPTIVSCPPAKQEFLSETLVFPIPWDVRFTDNDKVKSVTIIHNGQQVDKLEEIEVGVHEIQYIAKDPSGHTTTCSSEVVVASTLCKYLENQKNVQLQCETYSSGKNCTASCPDGEGLALPGVSIFCTTNSDLLTGQNQQQIEKNAELPSCTETTDESVAILETEVHLEVEDCPEFNEEFTAGFGESYTTSVLNNIDECGPAEDTCSLQNFELVSCGDDATRQTRAVGKVLDMKFAQRIPLSPSNTNFTAASAKLMQSIKSQVEKKPIEFKVDGKPYKVSTSTPLAMTSSKGCPPGYGSGSNGCVKCPPGMYHDISSDQCRQCASGSYQSQLGQTECTMCSTKKTKDDLAGVTAESGCVSPSEEETEGISPGIIIVIVILILVLIVVAVGGAILWRRYKTSGKFLFQPKPTTSHPANPLVMSDIMENVEKGDISISNPGYPGTSENVTE